MVPYKFPHTGLVVFHFLLVLHGAGMVLLNA